MNQKIQIFTDGSSLGNPGPGGYGVVIKILEIHEEFSGKSEKKSLKTSPRLSGTSRQISSVELSGGEPDTTNNRMEMRAMIEALKWVKKSYKNLPIELFSDSQLLINSLNLNWKRKKNLDLWQDLDQAQNGLNIKYIWLKGHAGHRENERCDQLARQSAAKIARLPLGKISSAQTFGKKIQPSLFED